MNPTGRHSKEERNRSRIRMTLLTLDLILKHKPIDDDYMEALLWIRTRLERNLKEC